MSHERRPPEVEQGTATSVRIGFDPQATAVFDRLSAKEREGLRRKLTDFARDPLVGKPLTGELAGFRRVTYGRIRSIATTAEGGALVICYVLWIGLRKAGSPDDPYELAVRALNRRDADAMAGLKQLVLELTEAAARSSHPRERG